METSDHPMFLAPPMAGYRLPNERNPCRQNTAQTACSHGESEIAESEQCSETRDFAGLKERSALRPCGEKTENNPPFAAALLHRKLSRTTPVERATTLDEPEHFLPIKSITQCIRITSELEISLFR